MKRVGCDFPLTRRGVLTLAGGVGLAAWNHLYGSESDFWNKKDPKEWTSAEIEKLISKSPWAKETGAQYSHDRSDGDYPNGSGYPNGGGYPGGGGRSSPGGMGGGGPLGTGGGGGYPGGMGGGGMGGGRRGGRRGQPMESIQGTVRWESAKPVMEAIKTSLPEGFTDHYVISVSGFPLSGSRSSREDSDTNSSPSSDDMLDQLKSLSYLEPKGRDGAQPGLVQKSPSAGGGTLLFGFSKDMLAIKPEDKEVTFSTKLGRLLVKTKFNLKDMMYHGELAL